MRSLAFIFTLAFASVAFAQPMMMDPSKMSGIPRPDPQVPAGTITVRLIRGQLSNRVVGTAVTLSGPDGKSQVQKTDAEGRATFAGLAAPGPYLASAKDGDVEQKTQPLQLEATMGTRVMLVFPLAGAGAPDGAGHLDKSLPVGTVVVRVEDGAGQAMEGLDVELAHANKGEQKVDVKKGKTDVAGEVKFEGLDHSPVSGYVAQVTVKGAPIRGKPFLLEQSAGARVVLQANAVSTDTSQLSFAEGSHLLVEVTDDTLQVIEVLRLHNSGASMIDPGADGLHIPLPRDALQIQAGEGATGITIADHDAVFRNPIPPGDTQLRVGFALMHKDGRAELVQPAPVQFAKIAMVTQALDGLTVSGHNVVGEERDMQGRKLMVFFGDPTDRGGQLHLSFAGLPTSNAMPRYIAAGLVVALILIFGIYAAGGNGDERGKLERERQQLFDELTRIDAALARGETADHAAVREKHVTRLAEIYRGLDELGGG